MLATGSLLFARILLVGKPTTPGPRRGFGLLAYHHRLEGFEH
jgi:hypothetical protein